MLTLFGIVLFAMGGGAGAVASTQDPVHVEFRDSATVNDTVIRLRDIASLTSPVASDLSQRLLDAIVGEAAPAGYCRKVNSSEVVYYVLKKQLFGSPFTAIRNKSITVTTAHLEKKVGNFEPEIIKYLTDSVGWKSGDYSIVLRNKEDTWKCLDKPLSIRVVGLTSKYPKGIVSLKIVARQFSKVYSVPVVCFVSVVTPVIVAKSGIPRGSMLTRDNCILERKDITHFACIPYTDLSQLNDLISNRTIQAETILHQDLTSRMPIISKDEQVFVVVDRGSVRVSIVMRAREKGAIGEKIWVENESTHKLLKTKVIGKGKVEMLEGAKLI